MRAPLRFLLALLALFAALPASAQTFPKFTGLVVDAANKLSPATKADLTTKLQALQKDTNRQLVVATIPDLQAYPLADYGYRLGRAWGIGLNGANNGAILFIAPNEPTGQKGPRIEVGYGLESVLTDAFSSSIALGLMTPMLQKDNVDGAMEAGTDALIQQLRASPDEAKARTDAAVARFDQTHRRSSGGGAPLGLIFWAMVIGFIGLSFLRRGSQGGSRFGGSALPIFLWGSSLGGWGGGGGGGGGGSSHDDDGGGWGGGGFTGGGGGSFGGGGASGGW